LSRKVGNTLTFKVQQTRNQTMSTVYIAIS